MGELFALDSLRTSIMISLGIIFAVVTAIGAQERASGKPDWKQVRLPSSSSPNSIDTVIENKNVNIIVNVDPKEVAKELWKLLQSRLNERDSRRSSPTASTLGELEKIVTPVVKPTRRNGHPRMYDVALALDRVTRSAILGDYFREPTIDDEIDIHEIVARMMFKLKTIMESGEREENGGMPNSRRSLVTHNRWTKSSDDGQAFVTVVLKISRKSILDGNVVLYKSHV